MLRTLMDTTTTFVKVRNNKAGIGRFAFRTSQGGTVADCL